MRTLVVLICSLALALVSTGAQEPQTGKQKKKAAPTQQGAPQGAKPVGRPQANKAAGPTAEYGKAKGGAHPTQPNKPYEYGKVKGQGQAVYANKPAEAGKAKGKGQVANANKPAELGKAKGAGKGKVTGQAAAASQAPGAPHAAVAGKPGKAGVTAGKRFKPQHFNLQTNKVVTKYKTVNFNQNYKIAGAYKWKGPKYAVFVNYHPLWQSQWWWQSHYNHIVFIYGGWYYWNAGYWCPAWGYAPDSVYYFDGPIYASSPDEDPAQVVANVQSALQQQGYYQGEIDGILGPQTCAALAEYQSAQGLEPTGAVDEPTLETLGMA